MGLGRGASYSGCPERRILFRIVEEKHDMGQARRRWRENSAERTRGTKSSVSEGGLLNSHGKPLAELLIEQGLEPGPELLLEGNKTSKSASASERHGSWRPTHCPHRESAAVPRSSYPRTAT